MKSTRSRAAARRPKSEKSFRRPIPAVSGRVFISCGQATDEERTAARSIAELLQAEGFAPYVATQVQTILDLNGEVILELKKSDYYLFINFRREPLGRGEFRGSLFAHQELAIAYSLGFDKMLFLNQAGVRSEGMLRYIISNVPEFKTCADVQNAVKRAVRSAGWVPSYSRNLFVHGIRWGPVVRYRDHTGESPVSVLYADIVNGRPDLGAIGTVARLSTIVTGNRRTASTDRSHLKATAYPGYEQTIFPGSHGAFDILALAKDRPHTVALNSALDVVPRSALISSPGEYVLEYEVFAQSFPLLTFSVQLQLRAVAEAHAKLVSQEAPFVTSVGLPVPRLL
jgi:hypothetical protein